MPDIEKLISKIRNQVNNVSFDELEKLLAYFGFDLVRQKGSHCMFKSEDGRRIVIPRHNPVKAVYVKLVLSLIKERS